MNYFGNIINLYTDFKDTNEYYLAEDNFENYLCFNYKINGLHYVTKLSNSDINNLENLNLQELFNIAFKTDNLYIYKIKNLELVKKFNPTIISSDKYLSGLKY